MTAARYAALVILSAAAAVGTALAARGESLSAADGRCTASTPTRLPRRGPRPGGCVVPPSNTPGTPGILGRRALPPGRLAGLRATPDFHDGLPGGASDIAPDVRAVLSRDLLFSAPEIADLERGRIVRHALGATAATGIAVAGATRVNAPKSRFLDRVRDIVNFKRGPNVLQIGTFSMPPVPADLDALTVDANDFDARSCRVNDCDIRLPAAAIMRVAEIDRRGAGAQARVAALFKQILFEHVSAYVSGRAGRITQYDDGRRPIRPAVEFDGLLAHAPALGALVPGLPEHLRDFPASPLEGARDFLYWSKEKFGFAPFITVTHVTMVCRSEATCVVASKDVYSSRYIDASLSISIATDAPSAGGFYLVYANRSRASGLSGFLGGLRRAIAERRAKAGLEDSLRTIRRDLEQR